MQSFVGEMRGVGFRLVDGVEGEIMIASVFSFVQNIVNDLERKSHIVRKSQEQRKARIMILQSGGNCAEINTDADQPDGFIAVKLQQRFFG